MSGYLQNGEAVIMKAATLKWIDKLKEYDAKLVNFVHDEWQIECPNNMKIALKLRELVSQSLVTIGLELNLNCPMAVHTITMSIKITPLRLTGHVQTRSYYE